MEAKLLRRVMIVDDEPAVVNAVERELSILPLGHYAYEIEGFSDPAAALKRTKEAAFDAVIADFRMPGMNGLEFLKALAVVQPDCARLVLSGQTDMDNLIRMINETHIYRFIPKPWHDYFLKSSLAQALDYAEAVAENRRLADIVRQQKIDIPPLGDDNNDLILIVDGDPGVLASLSRALTHHSRVDDLFAAIRTEIAHRDGPLLNENRISVQTTPSPAHALKMATDVSFACVIADFRMAEMNGIEFLQKFSAEQPDCARILISGAISQEELVYAVDSAHIYGFIGKPWQDFELKSTVAQALTWRQMHIENRELAKLVKASGADTAIHS